jgi:mono/diheme cytochrome c family protein
MESLPPGSGDAEDDAPDSPDAEADRPDAGDAAAGRQAALTGFDADRAPDLERGADIYRSVCRNCHGAAGEGAGEQGAPLPAGLAIEDIIVAARSGVADTAMVSFASAYSIEELHDVASHIVDEILDQP